MLGKTGIDGKSAPILLALLLSLQCTRIVECFAPRTSKNVRAQRQSSLQRPISLYQSNGQVDVSDLGLTMDDLNAPLPAELLRGIATSGYESTSRIPSVQDDACMWTEEESSIKATLAIPGLRGQPPAALSVEFATNTVSVFAFGQIVWSAILRGDVKPETLKIETFDGPDLVPVIELEIEKATTEERWGGFILQIGENSIL